MNGKLIVFEGIDGCGKNTQSKLLNEYFINNKIWKSNLIHFPCYSETFFGKEVGKYLNGDFGSLKSIHPKFASILYAGDRYEKRKYLLNKLKKNEIIICDRYVPSNIAHQIAKLPRGERSQLKFWIESLEYDVFKLPRPNLIIFLDLPPHLTKSLVLKKQQREYTQKKQDLHEENEPYLNDVYDVFCGLSSQKNWHKVTCYDGHHVRKKDDIFSEIKNIVSDFLSQ